MQRKRLLQPELEQKETVVPPTRAVVFLGPLRSDQLISVQRQAFGELGGKPPAGVERGVRMGCFFDRGVSEMEL